MSVLLRQPRGFEGLLVLLVHGPTLDCSVADCPHKGATNNHLDPATPLQVLGPGRYYEITGFDEFVGLHPSGFPGLAEFLQESPALDQVRRRRAKDRLAREKSNSLPGAASLKKASQSSRLYASILALMLSGLSPP